MPILKSTAAALFVALAGIAGAADAIYYYVPGAGHNPAQIRRLDPETGHVALVSAQGNFNLEAQNKTYYQGLGDTAYFFDTPGAAVYTIDENTSQLQVIGQLSEPITRQGPEFARIDDNRLTNATHIVDLSDFSVVPIEMEGGANFDLTIGELARIVSVPNEPLTYAIQRRPLDSDEWTTVTTVLFTVEPHSGSTTRALPDPIPSSTRHASVRFIGPDHAIVTFQETVRIGGAITSDTTRHYFATLTSDPATLGQELDLPVVAVGEDVFLTARPEGPEAIKLERRSLTDASVLSSVQRPFNRTIWLGEGMVRLYRNRVLTPSDSLREVVWESEVYDTALQKVSEDVETVAVGRDPSTARGEGPSLITPTKLFVSGDGKRVYLVSTPVAPPHFVRMMTVDVATGNRSISNADDEIPLLSDIAPAIPLSQEPEVSRQELSLHLLEVQNLDDSKRAAADKNQDTVLDAADVSN